MTSAHDRAILRDLAKKWMELANLPIMEERKRQWTALKNLKAERPMLLLETWTMLDFLHDKELQCEDQALRGVEHSMIALIRQAEEIGDDMVVEPIYRVGWNVETSDHGIPYEMRYAEDSIAYLAVHPIHSPEEAQKLKPRTSTVNREATIQWKDRLADIFGDILGGRNTREDLLLDETDARHVAVRILQVVRATVAVREWHMRHFR